MRLSAARFAGRAGRLLLLALAFSSASPAADLPRTFEDPEREQRYQTLLKELRCLVCQNQSLSDSGADLAQDMRDEVYRLLQEGYTDRQVADYLVQRYGDFVLYRPPLKISTYFLWFAPFLLLLGGLATVLRFAAHRGAAQSAPELAPEERNRQETLLSDDSGGQSPD